MKLRIFLAALLATGSVAGVLAADDAPAQVTFAEDIAPIFQKHCQDCHRPGDVGPMSLLTYEDSRPWAKSIKKAVSSRTMPPFHAENGDFPFSNDISLSDEQIAKVVKWVDLGAPMGDESKLPAPREFQDSDWLAGTPDLILQPDRPYVVGKEVDDEYRCFVMPTGLEEDTWMQGIEYTPGNKQVVHHIMAYVDTTGKMKAMDDATPEPGFLCGMSGGGGGGGQRLDLLLGGWAPGTPPNIFPPGVGKLIPAGSDIVYQCHYHNTSGEDQEDQSNMGFHFARETIDHDGKISLVGAFMLNIPPGEKAAKHEAKWRAPFDLTLYSVMPHMHYLGSAMKVTATYPDGETKVLVDVPRYDFNWQTVYTFEDPLEIPRGTKLHMTALHDNSVDNPYNPSDPPKQVTWGEATDEEMAHCWLSFVKKDQELGIEPNPPVVK